LGSIQLAIFGACWLVLDAGYPASSVFIVAIIANLLMFKVRLLIVRRLIALPLAPYYVKVLLPLGVVVLASAIPVLMLKQSLNQSLLGSVAVVLFSMGAATVCMYCFGLNQHWRNRV